LISTPAFLLTPPPLSRQNEGPPPPSATNQEDSPHFPNPYAAFPLYRRITLSLSFSQTPLPHFWTTHPILSSTDAPFEFTIGFLDGIKFEAFKHPPWSSLLFAERAPLFVAQTGFFSSAIVPAAGEKTLFLPFLFFVEYFL